MQDRLFRSRPDRVIGGVCGGLAKYFELDPVVVRLVAILLGISGFGVPLYIALWVAIPAEPVATTFYTSTGLPQQGVAPQQLTQQHQESSLFPSTRVPDPSSYRFDPYTGQPIVRPVETIYQSAAQSARAAYQSGAQPASSDAPATGSTVNLRSEAIAQALSDPAQASAPPSAPPAGHAPPARAESRSRMGLLLLITGAILMANEIGFGSFFIPLILIGLGVMILARR